MGDCSESSKKLTFKRLGVFIDSENLEIRAKKRGWRVDFGKLLRYIESEFLFETIDAYYYSRVVKDPPKKTVQFYHNINMYGYHLKQLKPKFKIIKKDGSEEGEVKEVYDLDGRCILDMAFRINQFDTFLIITGDGDFYEFVEEALERDKKVIIFSNSNLSRCYKKNVSLIKVNIELRKVRERISYEF